MDKKQKRYFTRRAVFKKHWETLWQEHFASLEKGGPGLITDDYPIYCGGYYDKTKRKNGASF